MGAQLSSPSVLSPSSTPTVLRILCRIPVVATTTTTIFLFPFSLSSSTLLHNQFLSSFLFFFFLFFFVLQNRFHPETPNTALAAHGNRAVSRCSPPQEKKTHASLSFLTLFSLSLSLSPLHPSPFFSPLCFLSSFLSFYPSRSFCLNPSGVVHSPWPSSNSLKIGAYYRESYPR